MASLKTDENEKVLDNVKGITFLPFQPLLSFSLAKSRKTEDREKEEEETGEKKRERRRGRRRGRRRRRRRRRGGTRRRSRRKGRESKMKKVECLYIYNTA
jgi:hypothetical protein